MPVNLLPVLIPLFFAWAAFAYFLFRWRKWAGWSLLTLTALVVCIFYVNTGVDRHEADQMRFDLKAIGDHRLVILTAGHGVHLTLNSPRLAQRLKGRESDQVQVKWIGTYNFGRLRSYQIQTIDGIDTDQVQTATDD